MNNMQNFIIRGLPDFSCAEKIKAVSVEALINLFDCKVKKDFLGYKADFLIKDTQKRIMLYMRCTPDNHAEVQFYCNDGHGGICMTVDDGGNIKTTGSWSKCTIEGHWYNIRAAKHPDYANKAKQAKALQLTVELNQAALEAEKEKVRITLEDVIEKHGCERVMLALQAL